ncbi:MAG: hypothetical protein JWO77_2041 [Ilumatobacteraceae bacterium]|nr:hypothetical protein [Ilumatobacteraceae bacterium]
MPRFHLTSIRARIDRTAAIWCDACGGDRTAEVCDGRRRLAVGSVAVLPWSRGTGHVRCTTCDERHPTAVLDVMTSAELAERLDALTRILTVMVVRTGDPSDRVLRRRAVQHVRTAVPGYHQNQLDIDMVALDPATVAPHVEPLADALDTSGKERVVANLVHVALAAHTISSHQRWLIDRVGRSLGLTPVHVSGIIAAAAASVEPIAEDPADRP